MPPRELVVVYFKIGVRRSNGQIQLVEVFQLVLVFSFKSAVFFSTEFSGKLGVFQSTMRGLQFNRLPCQTREQSLNTLQTQFGQIRLT
jgi:hypothetical protein